jgi:hypothetical protein
MLRISFKSMLFGAMALLMAVAFAGCENPFDPLDKSDKIEGLTYVDFTAALERWDSDPQMDGLLVTLSYSNEFGDSLAFHDKPHKVVIEFWTQKDKNEGEEGSSTYYIKDQLFFSKTIEFSNSDDDIRIPIEAYYSSIPADLFGTDGIAAGMVIVRVFPPQEYPRRELIVAQGGDDAVTLYDPEKVQDQPL